MDEGIPSCQQGDDERELQELCHCTDSREACEAEDQCDGDAEMHSMIDAYTGKPSMSTLSTQERLYDYFHEPVPSCTICLFRVLVGVSLFLQREKIHRETSELTERSLLFSFPGMDFIMFPPDAILKVLFILFDVLPILIAVGLCTRMACVAYALAFAWWQHLDQLYCNTHFYFELHLCCAIAVVNASELFSVGHLLRVIRRRLTWTSTFAFQSSFSDAVIPRWNLVFLQTLCIIPYVGGCLAKFNANWLLHAGSLPVSLPRRLTLFELGKQSLVQFGLAWGGFVFDGAIAPLLFWKRTRYVLAFPAVLMFNIINKLLFGIGSFPYFMIASLVLFIDPHKFGLAVPSGEIGSSRKTCFRMSTFFIPFGLYFAFHMLVPLRHFVFPSQPEWTEEGHLYAWHMKQRTKRGDILLFAEVEGRSHPSMQKHQGAFGEQTRRRMTFVFDPFLDQRVGRGVSSNHLLRPTVLLKYIHHLRGLLRESNYTVLAIKGDSCVRLNTHSRRQFLNSSTDLKDAYYPFACLLCFKTVVPDIVLPFEADVPCSDNFETARGGKVKYMEIRRAARRNIDRLYARAGFVFGNEDGKCYWKDDLAVRSWNRYLRDG